MAGTASVLEDSSLLSRLDRALLPLERAMALVSGLAAFSLMFFAVWSVGARKFFANPMLGYVDYIEALMPVIAILGVSYVQREGGHIRMDIVVSLLKGRALWLFELITVTAILLLMLALVWGAWAHFDRSFDFSRPFWSRDSSIDVGMPLWPSKIVVPLAFAVLCLRAMLQITGYARAFLYNIPRPAGVPLVLSAAEQAMAEAEQLERTER